MKKNMRVNAGEITSPWTPFLWDLETVFTDAGELQFKGLPVLVWVIFSDLLTVKVLWKLVTFVGIWKSLNGMGRPIEFPLILRQAQDEWTSTSTGLKAAHPEPVEGWAIVQYLYCSWFDRLTKSGLRQAQDDRTSTSFHSELGAPFR